MTDAGNIPGVTESKLEPGSTSDDAGIDLMTRQKRDVNSPSFDDIYTFISRPVSNDLHDELTARLTSSVESDGENSHEGGMKSIMNELKASKHHKLTRSDIRQLAKKAVILATLKKLKEDKSAKTTNPATRSNEKPVSGKNMSKASKKHKKSKKAKKKHHVEKHTHTPATGTVAIGTTTAKDNEMSEDLSQNSKKHLDGDSSSPKESDKTTGDAEADLMPTTDTSSELTKKSNINKIDDSVANMFDDYEISKTASTTTERPSALLAAPGKSQLADKVKSLRSFLAKADPAVIPLKFLPDLPSGLRMIGWKEMVDKKKKQLNELEATVGTVDDASDNKPVSLNIDVDDPLSSKTSASETGGGDLTEMTGDKKSQTETDPASLQHIGYLQRHIKNARSLRKLIAKTLVGHCKSTGKRIFDAFVAMDKALARAQTIATVIGKKFNIDVDRIDVLVGDKEDQVVETFLKDIFTKM